MFKKKEKKNVVNGDKIKKKIVHSRKDSAQKTIPFLNIYDDGIVEISKGKFSKTIEFPDINYHMANEESQEGIFVKYCELLNYFNSSAHLQITINNKSINTALLTALLNIWIHILNIYINKK